MLDAACGDHIGNVARSTITPSSNDRPSRLLVTIPGIPELPIVTIDRRFRNLSVKRRESAAGVAHRVARDHWRHRPCVTRYFLRDGRFFRRYRIPPSPARCLWYSINLHLVPETTSVACVWAYTRHALEAQMAESLDFSNVHDVYTAIVQFAHRHHDGDDTDLTRSVVDTALSQCLEQLTPQQRRVVWDNLTGGKTGVTTDDDRHATVLGPGDHVRVLTTGIKGIVECNLGPKFCPPIVLTSGALHFENELERL